MATQFADIIRAGDLKSFNLFLEALSPNEIDAMLNSRETGSELSPLQVACEIGNIYMVKKLCRLGANVNTDIELDFTKDSPDTPYVSPAALACLNGHYDVVFYLLEVRKAIFEVDEFVNLLEGKIVDEENDGEFETVESVPKAVDTIPTFAELADTSRRFSLLFPSVYSGHEKILSFLIRCGANVNLGDPSTQNASIIAAVRNQLDVLKVLIAKNAKFVIDANGIPLREMSLAVEHGSIDIVKYFLENPIVKQSNISCSIPMENLDPIIRKTISKRNTDILKLFLDRFPNIIVQHAMITTTAINGTPDDLRFLLSHVAAVPLRNSALVELFGTFPKNFEISENFLQNVEVLLEFGAIVNFEINNIPTAFFAARISLSLLILLEKYGLDLCCTLNGRTLLHEPFSAEIFEHLLSKPEVIGLINVKSQSGYRRTPLMEALRNQDVVKLLIQNGADLNAKDDRGLTALQIGIKECSDVGLTFIKELLLAGVERSRASVITALKAHNFNALKLILPPTTITQLPPSFFEGILLFAVKTARNRPTNESMKYLIENASIDINFKDIDGYTLAHYVVEYNNYEMLQYLIERDAIIAIRNKDGLNVADMAVKMDSLACVGALLDRNLLQANKPVWQNALPIDAIKGNEFARAVNRNSGHHDVRKQNFDGFVKLATLTKNKRLVWNCVNRICIKVVKQNPEWMPDPYIMKKFDELAMQLLFFHKFGDVGDVEPTSVWTQSIVRKCNGILLTFVARNWSVSGQTLPSDLHYILLRYREIKWKNQVSQFQRRIKLTARPAYGSDMEE